MPKAKCPKNRHFSSRYVKKCVISRRRGTETAQGIARRVIKFFFSKALFKSFF